ncbi:MAG: hypothetical protein V4543_16460 [Bacteroidota bacterium]
MRLTGHVIIFLFFFTIIAGIAAAQKTKVAKKAKTGLKKTERKSDHFIQPHPDFGDSFKNYVPAKIYCFPVKKRP